LTITEKDNAVLFKVVILIQQFL